MFATTDNNSGQDVGDPDSYDFSNWEDQLDEIWADDNAADWLNFEDNEVD